MSNDMRYVAIIRYEVNTSSYHVVVNVGAAVTTSRDPSAAAVDPSQWPPGPSAGQSPRPNGFACRATTATSEQGRTAASDAMSRPLISSISIRTAGSEADASVVVSTGAESYEGRSIGPSSMSHRHTLVARATLDAVGELLGLPAEIEVATVTTMGSRQMAACVIQVAVPRVGELVLTGSALVRGDEADAVARAVLDALNRRLAG